MNARERRLSKAQMRVLFQVPFFAPAVAKLSVTWDDTIKTACTDGKAIRFNPEFFDKLPDQQVCTVLCHEAAHCLLGHNWRAPGGADWDLWNEACDHPVNLMLREFAEQVMAKQLADPFPMPEGALCNPAFKDLSEERIYSMMANKPKSPGGSGGGGGKAGQGGNPAGKPQLGQGQGQGQAQGQGQGQGQGRQSPAFGEMEKPKVGQTQKDKANWEATLQQCVFGSKDRGALPAGMERFIGELLNPKVPWYELVRQWLREKVDDDWNWMKPNVYFDDSGFMLPSLDSERVGAMVFATDTSGSMDVDVVNQTHAEKQNCLDDLKPSKLVDIYCDAQVHKVAEYRPGDTIENRAPGGGGTDFRPVFEHCESLQPPPKCLVYLTDLCGTFPDKEPGYPVLWIQYGDYCSDKPPFGEVVKAASFA